MKNKTKVQKIMEKLNTSKLSENIVDKVSNKKEIWESKLTKRNINESYSDMASDITADGTKVMAYGSTRSTRTYNYEDVTFKFGSKEGHGSYKWQNRPWQRFNFADALIQAMIEVGVEDKFARQCVEKTNGLDSAVEYFAKNYKAQDKQEVKESKKLKEEVSGWIAILDGKKVEIKKGEADSLYGAKKLAIKKFAQLFGKPLSKAKELQISIGPAYDDDAKDAPASSVQFESKKLKESHTPSFSNKRDWNGVFVEWLSATEFELIKNDKYWSLQDIQGANLGDIEDVKFKTAEEIIEKMDVYVKDYLFNDIKEMIGDSEELPKNFSCSDIVKWYTDDMAKKYPDIKFVITICDMIANHIKEIDLDKVFKASKNSDENLEEDLKIIIDLSQYEPWAGAVDTWDKIEEADLMTEFEQFMEEMYPDGLTKTELNDILLFDRNMILKQLGIGVDDDEEEDEEEMEG